MKKITIWGWGDDYKSAKTNSEICAKKFWKVTTKECRITLVGKSRSKDILFGIDAYTRDRESIGILVDRLLNLVLREKNKVYEITLELSEEEFQNNKTHLKELNEVRKQYKILERKCIEKVKKDPRVKALMNGRKILVFPDMHLFSELEPEYGIRMRVGAFHFNFNEMVKLVYSLSKKLIKKKLAKRILGYELSLEVDKLEISDIDVTEDEVLVDLAISETGKPRL